MWISDSLSLNTNLPEIWPLAFASTPYVVWEVQSVVEYLLIGRTRV